MVSNETDVCVFCTFTADGGLIGKGVHHFVVEDGLEVSFDLYWNSSYWAKHSKILLGHVAKTRIQRWMNDVEIDMRSIKKLLVS